MKKVESYYNREGNIYLIELKFNNLHQLFNSFDPSPFLEKDLDDKVENYIVQSVCEFPLKTTLKLVFYLPDELKKEAKQIVPEAIHHYFDYRRQTKDKELRAILREGRVALIVGLVFLFFCISVSGLIGWLNNQTLIDIFKEGLLIIGWVAMWRPLEIFLYDWWPIDYSRNIFEKLSHIAIEIR
ncbi:hypothetical protein [Pseudanabaena sp. PCC 6802]|uniref:hypothetical protein n=1 Tax=Pseudanabaena sp. PCC 6802 TaxID=118173 RepID=UPI000348F7D4|nr:hypothetical protein [Pseudanabaena sp. PCC 6802]